MKRIIGVLFAFLLLMQVSELVCRAQSVGADTEGFSELPISSGLQYGDSKRTENNQETGEAQPRMAQRRIQENELQLLKTRTGIGERGQNYNQLVNGHGTGLAPPSEEEWKLIEEGASMVDHISTTIQYSPSSWDNTAESWFPPIGDQGQQGSCVAWAVGYYTKTFQEAKEHNWNVKSGAAQDKITSPSFIYNLINYGEDGGSYYYDAIGLVCSVGACSLSRMPYNAGDYTSWPSQLAWKEAPLYRANASGISYVMLQNDAGLANLKTWLFSGNLAVLSVDAYKIVDPTWGWSLLDGNDMLTLDNYVNPSSNHAGTIVGYNDNFAYTEEGQTHYGAFKIANSWGVPWLPSPFGWEHICDGYYWISYEVMKQRIGYCMLYSDILDYTPELIATFGINHNKRGECSISVGAGNVGNPIATKRFDSYVHGGNVPFCQNYILLDVTEFMDLLTKTYDQQYFLQVYDGGSITVGTVTRFSINHAQSAGTPLYTVNNNFVFAYLTLTKMIVPDEYPTIQVAINSAWAGDAIFVRAGTYYENLVIDKAIELIGESEETTIIDGNLKGDVVTMNSSTISVASFTIRNSGQSSGCGILMIGTFNSQIENNKIVSNYCGIHVSSAFERSCHDNNISGNEISDNSHGIIMDFEFVYDNIISENTIVGNLQWAISASPDYGGTNIVRNNITRNGGGISYYWAHIVENNIAGNVIGIRLNGYSPSAYASYEKGGTVYHNNFVNNVNQVDVDESMEWVIAHDVWDDGYPPGGNYWSDYVGTDVNGDGVGDTPYVINPYNQDRYPLTNPWNPVYMCDGFESGSFSRWTGTQLSSGEIATVTKTLSHHGNYSAFFASNGGGGTERAYCYQRISSAAELYTRGYFYLSTSGITVNDGRFYFLIFKVGGTPAAFAGWRMTGGIVKWNLLIRHGTGWATAYSTTSPSLNQWYSVELHWKKDASAGLGELWVDGVLACSASGKNTGYYGDVDRVEFGLAEIVNSGATTVYVDCTRMANTYIGPEPRATIFEDGFESGSFGKWTGTGTSLGETASVSGTKYHHGSYSGSYTSNGNGGYENSYSYKSISSMSDLYVRGYFYVSQSGIAEDQDRFSSIVLKAGTQGVAYGGWRQTNKNVRWCLLIRNGTGWVTVNSSSLPLLNQWYCVELHWKKDATAGLGELWIDGLLVCSAYNTNTAYYGDVNRLDFGLATMYGCSTTQVYGDCAVVSSKYIGPESPPPPSTIFEDGYESGNFNNWTSVSLSSGETAAVVNTIAHDGTYSAEFLSNGNGGYERAYCYKTIPSATELYSSSYVRVAASGIVEDGDRFYFIVFKAGSNAVAFAGWRKTGGQVKWNLIIRDGTGWVSIYSTISPSLNQWHSIVLHWKKDAEGGFGELYVDGLKVCSATGKNSAYYGDVNRIEFGLPEIVNCGITQVYGDCCVVSKTWIATIPQSAAHPITKEQN